MREIPLKNYIILIFLLIFTALLTFWIFSFYSAKKAISPLYKYLNSIKIDEFNEYIMENPDSIIFAMTKNDTSNSDNQKLIKKKIESERLKDYCIFLELNSQDEIRNINLKNYNKKIEYCPSVIFVESGKVSSIVCLNDIEIIKEKINEVVDD